MLGAAFRRNVLARRWRCFAVLCLAFAAFGAGTFNLFRFLSLNLALIVDNGWQALEDGAAQQLLELVATLVLSMAAYVVFKSCEHALVHDLTHRNPEEPPA